MRQEEPSPSTQPPPPVSSPAPDAPPVPSSMVKFEHSPQAPRDDKNQSSSTKELRPMRVSAHIPPDTLHRAAAKGQLKKLEALLQDGWPSVDALDDALRNACSEGDLALAALLLLHGAASDPVGGASSPLHAASVSGQAEVVAELLRRGASVERPSADGETPLSKAAFHGHADVVQVCACVCDEMHSLGPREHSPVKTRELIAHSCQCHRPQLLIEARASLAATNDEGEHGRKTPLQRAREGDNPDVHPPSRWAEGNWPLCVRLLEDAEMAISRDLTEGAAARGAEAVVGDDPEAVGLRAALSATLPTPRCLVSGATDERAGSPPMASGASSSSGIE